MLADVLRDARYALRQLRKSPGFTVVAILTLALGIGATSAMFSVINGVLLRPLPYPEPDALVRVNEIVPQYGRFSVAPATFLDWRAAEHVVRADRRGYSSGSARRFTGSERRRARHQCGACPGTSSSCCACTRRSAGRSRPRKTRPGKNNVVVLSHGMWQRRFGGDRDVLGRSVTLNGAPATIVGVMPPGFDFPARQPEYWPPIALNPANATRGGHFLAVVARLKPGVTVAAGRRRDEDDRRAAGEAVSGRERRRIRGGRAAPRADRRRQRGSRCSTLLAAVGVVVLIACANVANLLLVRASVREKEIAIRMALGAGTARLVRQMLAESLVLALAGGVLGVLLAYLALGPIRTLSAGSIPRVQDITIDGTVLLFAVAMSLADRPPLRPRAGVAGVAAGVAGIMKEGGRSSATGGGRWVRNALLVAEVALSIVLLVGAALLLRSFAGSRASIRDSAPTTSWRSAWRCRRRSIREDHQRIAFFDKLLDRLEELPDVRSAGMVQTLPMRGSYVLSVAVQGRPEPKPGDEPSANHRVVSPALFRGAGHPAEARPALHRQDTEKSPMVAVIDEAFAARHFPDEDPIGRGLDIGNGTDGFYQIVGVVGNVHHVDLEASAAPTMYVPFRQDVFSTMWIVARSDRDPAQLVASARQTVREIDPALPAFAMTPLRDVDQRLGGAAALLDAAAGGVRGDRAVPRRGRHLRRGRLLRQPADAGDRRAHRDRRRAPRRARAGRRRRDEAGAVGVVIGLAGALRARAADHHHAVRRDAIRSVELRGHRRRAADDRGDRVLRAGSPGDERRSAGGDPAGVRPRRLEATEVIGDYRISKTEQRSQRSERKAPYRGRRGVVETDRIEDGIARDPRPRPDVVGEISGLCPCARFGDPAWPPCAFRCRFRRTRFMLPPAKAPDDQLGAGAGRDEHRPAVGSEPGQPVECAAVDQRNLGAIRCGNPDLIAQSTRVIGMLQQLPSRRYVERPGNSIADGSFARTSRG